MSRAATRRPRLVATAGRALSVLAVALAGALAVVTPAHAAAPTVVSLTFDDGQSSQADVLPLLQAHGMAGTFYINSAMVGSSGYYMNWSQIHEIAAAGNEIGGHTLHHVDLSTVDAATAQQEVCDDRANLVAQGFNPVSFAYPFASYTTGIEQTISSCGYTSARGVGGARIAESVPPSNPYVLRTPAPASSSMTAQDLENEVTAAENGNGGWVILTFHGTCEDLQCTGADSTKLSTLTTFLDWLQARQANGTVVRTVGAVMNGSTPTPPPPPTAPTTYIQCNAANCQSSAYTAPVSVSFVVKDHNPSSVPTTWYTTDGSDPTTSSTRTAYTAPFQVTKSSTVRYYTSDSIGAVEAPKSQNIAVNLAAPATSISCNDAPCTASAYTSAVTVKLAATDPNVGATTTTWFTTDGSDPTSSTTRSTYSAPFQVGATSTVRYYSTDSLGATETAQSQTVTVQLPPPPPVPPTTTITCDNAACASTAYTSAVAVRLSAADPNAGATASTWYTTDGSDPTSSATRTAYAGAFSLTRTSTVKYYSTDSLGATEPTKSQTVTVQIAPPPPPPPPAPSAPTTSMKCDDAACGTDAYHAAVSVTLHADDPQGASTTTWYTTDGSDPASSATRTAYTGAFSLPSTSTVKYYSTDSLGATEQVRSRTVTVELPPPPPSAPPTTTMTCNGAACTFGWYRAVTVRLQATGTGATTTWYTTDGSDPVTSATRSSYAGAFTLTRTRTVRFYSTDAGGANEAQQAQYVRVDGTGPSVSITSPKGGSRYARSATVTLTARATDRASGVRRVLFLDGTKVIGTATVPVKGSTYRCSWKLRHVALGAHRIRVVATDVAGNKGWATSVKVTVHR